MRCCCGRDGGSDTSVEARRARQPKIAEDAASRTTEEDRTGHGLNPALYHLPDMADERRGCLLRIKSGR